jgi:hypothetical protein
MKLVMSVTGHGLAMDAFAVIADNAAAPFTAGPA